MSKIVGNWSLKINFHNTESIRIIKLNEPIPGEIGSIECEERKCCKDHTSFNICELRLLALAKW